MTLKHQVLARLEENRAAMLSGEALAQACGVTRSAVWRAVQTLRKEGHQIDAATHRGYQLCLESDRLSPEGIRTFLPRELRSCPLLLYDMLDSTNQEAKRLGENSAAHGTVILAEAQSAGRGRGGHSFFSPPGTGLYMSVILHPKVLLEDALPVTAYAAVAVCKAIERLTCCAPKIKWVNDLFWQDKKIGGILTEGVSNLENGAIESLVLGIGLNFSTQEADFPPELRKIAGSLSPSPLLRNRLAAEIIQELLRSGDCLFPPSLMADYKKRSLLLGKHISYQRENQIFKGIAADIDAQGRLLVKAQDGHWDVLRYGDVNQLKKDGSFHDKRQAPAKW